MKNTMKELNLNEMENVAGGSNLLTHLVCLFDGCDWDYQSHYIHFFENTNGYEKYTHWHCSNCGGNKYTRYDSNTGKETKISKKEYQKYLP